MSERIGYMLAQTFRVATAYGCTTTDDRGGPTARTVATGWYRSFLCPAAGAGTETDPAELLLALETTLGASKWSVRMTASGLVRITYLGTGTGALVIPAELSALLGSPSLVNPLAAGAHVDGSYLPTHCLFAHVVEPDGGWVDAPGRFAGSMLPGGLVYGWGDGRVEMKRQVAFAAIPKTWALRTTLGAVGSPAYPALSRVGSPATGEPGQAPPWSALDTQATAAGVQCAVTWGDFEALVAGTITSYELVYLAPEQFSLGGRVSLWRQGYDARRSYALDLVFAGAATL